jgi:hypothetical protein
MHPQIEREIVAIYNGPIEDMISKWLDLNEKYAKPEDRIGNVSVQDYISKPHISLKENFEVLTNIGRKLFKKEIAIKKPRLILDFMDQYWGYADIEKTNYLESTEIYKNACAMDLYQSIISGTTCPTADPYFGFDPEHPVKLSLDYGIEKKLFTDLEVKKALKNQNRNSPTYKQLIELYLKTYDIEHKTFATNNNHKKKYADYGFHVFIGRIYDNYAFSNSEDFKYIELNNRGTTILEPNIESLSDCLWEAVRKNQKVLLTKSPGGTLEPLSSKELCNLYNYYYIDSKHMALQDPFLYQPKS